MNEIELEIKREQEYLKELESEIKSEERWCGYTEQYYLLEIDINNTLDRIKFLKNQG